MDANPPRLGFLVSILVHLSVVLLLLNRVVLAPSSSPLPVVAVPSPSGPAVFLPPAEVLRQLRTASPPPARPAPAPVATPVPTPPPQARDRISIGPPDSRRSERLILRKEDDLTAVPRGNPQGEGSDRVVPGAPASPAALPAPVIADGGDSGGRLRLPPGLGRERSGEDEGPGRRRPSSLSETLRNLDERLAQSGPRGVTSGTGQKISGFFFDPQGADFTAWTQHFKNEVYRNWIVPQAVVLGMRGHVDLEFTVERDGTISSLRLLKSAGNPAMDRSAANAILASRALPLPADYGPPQLTLQVTFFYNEGPA